MLDTIRLGGWASIEGDLGGDLAVGCGDGTPYRGGRVAVM